MKIDMKEIDMKPCPFCGADGNTKIESKKREVWRNGYGDEARYTTFHIRCTKCNARGGTVSGYVGKECVDGETVKMYGEDIVLHRYSYFAELAVNKWNERSVEDSREVLKDQLTGLYSDIVKGNKPFVGEETEQ